MAVFRLRSCGAMAGQAYSLLVYRRMRMLQALSEECEKERWILLFCGLLLIRAVLLCVKAASQRCLKLECCFIFVLRKEYLMITLRYARYAFLAVGLLTVKASAILDPKAEATRKRDVLVNRPFDGVAMRDIILPIALEDKVLGHIAETFWKKGEVLHVTKQDRLKNLVEAVAPKSDVFNELQANHNKVVEAVRRLDAGGYFFALTHRGESLNEALNRMAGYYQQPRAKAASVAKVTVSEDISDEDLIEIALYISRNEK
jgi:hypothetical protein